MSAPRRLVALALTIGSAGCASRLTVKKVEPGDTVTEGFRYALPIPYLLVCPTAAGELLHKWVYLPDPRATYAVSATSRLAKVDLDLELSDGLLDKLTWNGDSSAVPAELVKGAGKVATAALDQAAKRDDARIEELAKREQDVLEAQLEFDKAKKSLEYLRDHGGGETEIKKAGLAVELAQLDLTAAIAARDSMKKAMAPLLGKLEKRAAGETEAWGCVFYRVEDDGSGVRLIQASPQMLLSTAGH